MKKQKVKNIISGWKHVIKKDVDVEAIATTRLDICNQCPKKVNMLGIDVCGDCHCPLIAKVRSLDEVCPLSKW